MFLFLPSECSARNITHYRLEFLTEDSTVYSVRTVSDCDIEGNKSEPAEFQINPIKPKGKKQKAETPLCLPGVLHFVCPAISQCFKAIFKSNLCLFVIHSCTSEGLQMFSPHQNNELLLDPSK